eukprot:Amastigsp_a345628_142.p4 type:complete len:138 gc:universal Amastigsp_a345628_142:132-545(+)
MGFWRCCAPKPSGSLILLLWESSPRSADLSSGSSDSSTFSQAQRFCSTPAHWSPHGPSRGHFQPRWFARFAASTSAPSSSAEPTGQPRLRFSSLKSTGTSSPNASSCSRHRTTRSSAPPFMSQWSSASSSRPAFWQS